MGINFKVAAKLSQLRFLVFQGMAGKSPRVNNETGHWETYDNDAQDWADTGTKAQGDPGTPGVSPTVQTEPITGGHRVIITDAEHPSGQTFDVMDGESGKAKSAYLDYDVIRLVEDDSIYTAAMIIRDIDSGILPFVSTQDGDFTSEFFELDKGYSSSQEKTVYFRSREHLLAVDSTGHFTMTDRPQGGSGGGAVDSVNGYTGTVVLTASDVGALPSDTPIPTAVTEQTVAGWGFTKNTGTYSKPSGGIPKSDLASAVQTSLGKADTALQSAPVTSVNGKTGAVTVNEVPDYSGAIDGQVLTKTRNGPRWADNIPSSAASLRLLYDGAFGPDDPDLMLMGNVADAETGNAIATALYSGRIGSAVLVDVTDPNTETVYDLLAVDYDAQTHVSTVTFARTEADCIRTATLSGSTKAAPVFGTIPLGGLPTVTASDNGKFLRVADGAWAAESVSFQTPRVAMTSADTTPTLNPNTLYVFPEMASLAITLAAPADSTIVNEYHFIFASGATPTTLTIPAAVKTPDGFTVDANMVYEVSILEGCMTAQSWAVSA